MKKLMTLMLGLSLAIGCVSAVFGADEPAKTEKKSKKKSKKKKTGEETPKHQ